MGRFENKVVIVTGSSGGIGRAAAIQFAKEGASVTIHGQSKAKLDETKKQLLAQGIPEPRILVVSGPIQNLETQKALIENTVAKFGRLDVLVNNAGTAAASGHDPQSMESFDMIMNVNVRAPYSLIQLATDELEKTKGNVVNVSSDLSTLVFPSSIPYSISKQALDHLTRNFANTLASKGIRVNAVNPGLSRTDLLSQAGVPNFIVPLAYAGISASSIPVKRPGTSEEQADVIVQVASDESSYMTGSTVFNNGGAIVNAHPISYTGVFFGGLTQIVKNSIYGLFHKSS